ncbi:hypothetical protein GWC77_23565 [Paraburkholderia sp. NMBU_R16]|uniref:hypothetical protein n=1 Tax=Paraburkholderia sp. NMBU_R16 TaxID=2698676 RepID=UPI001563923E|nr:hypothetical protein [Paraburkholderia sp. NMBU_R16]NRO98890.1 hypothetical protein [Paraburkholderia sp. NMBU_R16]
MNSFSSFVGVFNDELKFEEKLSAPSREHPLIDVTLSVSDACVYSSNNELKLLDVELDLISLVAVDTRTAIFTLGVDASRLCNAS